MSDVIASISAARCPDCGGPITAVDPPVRWPAIAERWPYECVPCARLFSDVPTPETPRRDRDFVIAEQIALLERHPGALLVDLQEWALTSLRHEQALRQELRLQHNHALDVAASIALRLGET